MIFNFYKYTINIFPENIIMKTTLRIGIKWSPIVNCALKLKELPENKIYV